MMLSDSMRSRGEAESLRSGFSLLEVMIALAILALGILGVTAGQVMAIKNSASSRSNTIAMYLAEQQVEMMQASSATDVKTWIGSPNDPDNPIDPDTGDGVQMAFNRRAIVVADSPEVGVISIVVEVDWVNALGNTRTVRVQSFKADI